MRKDNRSAARATVNQERRSQGAGIAVGAGAVEAGAASGAVKDSISPASAADIRFDRLHASSALRPSFAIIGRWLGARPPVTALWISIEQKLAKPHRAKVAIAHEHGAQTARALPRKTEEQRVRQG